MLLMGKVTKSMAIFNSELLVYQRVTSLQTEIDRTWRVSVPRNCRVELQADEPRACEQPWVNWCQDTSFSLWILVYAIGFMVVAAPRRVSPNATPGWMPSPLWDEEVSGHVDFRAMWVVREIPRIFAKFQAVRIAGMHFEACNSCRND